MVSTEISNPKDVRKTIGIRPDVTYAATAETIFGAFGRFQLEKLYDVVIDTHVDRAHRAWRAVVGDRTRRTGRHRLPRGDGALRARALTLAVLIVPACALVGLGFAAAGLIAANPVRDWNDFQYMQLVMLPRNDQLRHRRGRLPAWRC